MLKFLVIADDFTGAADTGVQFAKNGISTIVVLYKNLDFSLLDENLQVAVVDTESRHIDPREAAARVREVARKGLEAGIGYFYKKTDSALRGNIGSELTALMQALGEDELMFVPAYPDAKRTTAGGCQYIDGIPVNETGFSKDPIDPVRGCDISHIINLQTDVKVVSLKTGGGYGDAFVDRDKTIYVFDAQSNADLYAIAGFLHKKRKLKITAGCAGFADTFPKVLEFKTSQRKKIETARGKTLILCGSINGYTLRQIAYAQKNGLHEVNLSASRKLDLNNLKTPEGDAFIDEIASIIRYNDHVMITTDDRSGDDCARYAGENNIGKAEIPCLIAKNLGNLASEMAKRTDLETVVIIGGDTAVEVIGALGIGGLVPCEEISTGTVFSKPIGKARRVNLITKSGGFGEEDSIIKIMRYINDHTGSYGG